MSVKPKLTCENRLVRTGPPGFTRHLSLYCRRKPERRRMLLSEIKERAILLQDNPLIGRIGRIDETQELVITGTQYILPYRLKEKQIQILAVFHTARKWPVTFK